MNTSFNTNLRFGAASLFTTSNSICLLVKATEEPAILCFDLVG